MKKLAILTVAVLGTFAMASAQTTPAPAKTKEVKTEKQDKKANKKAKGEKKAETAKKETPKAK
ncbi:hypothetical protein [Flavobacterium anhuiense]|uniref:hypothetical protein n=1 Tax=Flavobacterium anhuiense TaxID=459526 RepID=UPI00202623B6|nr:hypothetical protein [Flavobacterium anhuiense]URM38410.1 hypothetical protein LLY39_07655 [Flavobacterium anhuiense]